MPRFKTGAKPSPRHKLAATAPHVARVVPPAALSLPPRLSYWDNDRDGVCTVSEEAFAKAAWAAMLGRPETFIPDDQVVAWAKAHDALDGAIITDILDAMQRVGLVAEDGQSYTDGPYHSVDWTRDAVLCSAIYQGPVKIGVAAGQLQDVEGIGARNGWFASGFGHDADIDHCVSLCGYGAADQLAALFVEMGVAVAIPAGLAASCPCYAMFSWNSVGIVDRPSLIAICGEAWLRTPTTPQQPDLAA